MAETVISEAPAEQSGAENNQVRGPLSVEDLAASFVEQVETDQEAQQADEAKAEVTETPEEAEASADQDEDVLSQSVTEESEEEETEEDTEEEEVEEEVEEETPKAVGKLLKQVGKLTARAKSAEETVESLKSEIQNLKQSGGSQSSASQPELENIQSFEDLENLKREAQAAKKFALQHIGKDFVEIDGKEWSDDDIRNILTQADEYLTEKIPQRSEYLRKKASGTWTQSIPIRGSIHRKMMTYPNPVEKPIKS